jgi:hypothetical protein
MLGNSPLHYVKASQRQAASGVAVQSNLFFGIAGREGRIMQASRA